MSKPLSSVEKRWEQLCQKSKASTEHCGSRNCFDGSEVDICSCDCDACQLSNELLLQAQEELGV